jgi:hypothetical protein
MCSPADGDDRHTIHDSGESSRTEEGAAVALSSTFNDLGVE